VNHIEKSPPRSIIGKFIIFRTLLLPALAYPTPELSSPYLKPDFSQGQDSIKISDERPVETSPVTTTYRRSQGWQEARLLDLGAAKKGAARRFDEHESEAPFQEAAKRFLSQNSFSLPTGETLIMRWILRQVFVRKTGGFAGVPVEYQNGRF
jgi:hypothetical protein